MVNNRRVWCVLDVDAPKELAEKLTERTWTLCTGFRHRGYLYLNDSFSENGAQEYGVINEKTGKQVESITFSWCNYDEALAYIKDISEGKYDYQAWDSGVDLSKQIQAPEQHGTCPFCA